MTFQHFAGAAYRALTAPKDGPSLYDVCDPLLLSHGGGDQHLSKFYKTALGNPALRPLLRRAGLAELRDESCLQSLREALTRARDDKSPDWTAIGRPVAALLDTIDVQHPKPRPVAARARPPGLAEIEPVIRTCGAHLLRSFGRCGFIPTYAAFNLIGDADLRGRELLMALTGLNSRGYKNSTLLFNLARIFISRSPARALINPPWTGSTDPILEQPLLDFYAGYQVRDGANEPLVTVPLNDNIDYEGGVATWIDNLAGERPFGNDLDPTLISTSSKSVSATWFGGKSSRARSGWIRFIGSSAFKNAWPQAVRFRSAIAYLLLAGTLLRLFRPLLRRVHRVAARPAQQAIDPDGAFDFHPRPGSAYVQGELIVAEMNVFDAALALIALGHLGADAATLTPALHCIVSHLGEGGRRGPFKAYEWNKMKTPTRILVGGPEVTSAFVLMGLALARRAMMQGAGAR